MNFLSHHAVARQVAGQAPPLFYAGNLLPDFLGISGEGSLKRHHVEGKIGPLAEGVRLHLATDKRFHEDPAFTQLCAEASGLLKSAPLTVPMHRVFFYAHVAVELALDAHLLRHDPSLAEELFAQLHATQPALITEALPLVGVPELPRLEHLMAEFIRERWVLSYAEDVGCARRLGGLGRRIGHALPPPEDLDTLAEVFTALRVVVAPEVEGLLLRSGGM